MSASFDRLLRSSRLAMAATSADAFIVDRSIRLTRPDRDELRGKVQKSRPLKGGGPAQKLAGKLAKRLKTRPPPRTGKFSTAAAVQASFDPRQRAVVNIHYFNHSGGGGAGLKAHGKYIARDAAGRDALTAEPDEASPSDDRPGKARAHADYLERGGARGAFYDGTHDGVDGAASNNDRVIYRPFACHTPACDVASIAANQRGSNAIGTPG
jgi:hypothetical protein